MPIPNPFVGPQVLRYQFRYPQTPGANLVVPARFVDPSSGAQIVVRLPHPLIGPPALRRQLQRTQPQPADCYAVSFGPGGL